MKKLEGIHFYINIPNLLDIIEDEENKTQQVNHSIHVLDTYFASIERYGKRKYPDSFIVEKVTGSRLHMYVVSDIADGISAVRDISYFAQKLSYYISTEIGKYKSLIRFSIQVGACHGEFYDFVFKDGEFEEETTIGFAANYAAKLQNLTKPAYISISSDMYEKLDEDNKKSFVIVEDQSIGKYGQEYFATSLISDFKSSVDYAKEYEDVKKYANNLNLNDIKYSDAKINIDFASLSRSDCKKLIGIPLFSDVRGFTEEFDANDSNLEEMAIRTQSVLKAMYDVVNDYHGTHIQFQGDREVALFHTNANSSDAIIDAVTAGLKMIDGVKNVNLSVGIGQSLGNVFAYRIGARGEKDNIILGKTVNEADEFEDKYAGENHLVISKEIYEHLKATQKKWVKYFKETGDGSYCITVGYRQLFNSIRDQNLINDRKQNNYNGAWGE